MGVACEAATPAPEWTLQAEEIWTLGGGPAAAQTFDSPRDVAFDGGGRVHVLDTGHSRIQLFDARRALLGTLGGQGPGPGQLDRPEGFWVFPSGEVVVADTGNRRVQRYGPSGDLIAVTQLDYPPLDVVGASSRLYVQRLPPPYLLLGPDDTPLIQSLTRDGEPVGDLIHPDPHRVGVLFFLLNLRRLAAAPGGGFALAHTHVSARFEIFDRLGDPVHRVPFLYKAEAWAPLGRLPADVNDASLGRVARTCTELEWDPYRRLYWVLAGYVDRRSDGEWVLATELYRYTQDGTYRGSVMLPYEARAIAAAPDQTLAVVDTNGIVHGIRLLDPDAR